MRIIEIVEFERADVNCRIELKYWKDFVDLAEQFRDEINNEWVRDNDRIVFFDGKNYYMISGDDLFWIDAKAKSP